jgi:glycerol-3-phosphate dehydrogenase
MSPVRRQDHLAALATGVDVLVIGGGITGAGVALDAATRGYRVGLVEQADFAGGTSSRSTKLVHGGLRYLARAEVCLVAEALRERDLLVRLAPHLVRPQPFVLPLYDTLSRPLGVSVAAPLRRWMPAAVEAVLWGYDRLTRAGPWRHRRLAPSDAAALVPALRTDGLRAAFVLYDAATDDVRLTQAVLATARRWGAATVNYARAVALVVEGGRVVGAEVEDRLTGRRAVVRARHVVNAAGVWAQDVAALAGPPAFHLRPSKGVHLVLRREVLGRAALPGEGRGHPPGPPRPPGLRDGEMALILPETEDGRIAFLVPWAGRVLLGTTDDPYTGPLDRPAASASEVAFLLRHARRFLARVDDSHVVGVFAGLRPLLEAGRGRVADLSRRHAVVESPRGLVSIVGGKLTTYRQMAEQTVDLLVRRDGGRRRCRTRSLPLAGADGLSAAAQVLAHSSLSADQRRHLLQAYGGAAPDVLALAADPALARPLAEGVPVLAAEVVYACREEMAVTLEDMMFLRTELSILADDAGRSAVARVADLMAAELGWSVTERHRQQEAWEARLERERQALQGL